MIEVYLLISLFSQFSPLAPVPTAVGYEAALMEVSAPAKTAVEVTAPFQIIVDFPEINGLRPGSPVLVEGNLVGRVKQISSKPPQRSRRQAGRSFEVALDLDSSFSARLALGTCALQALPMTDAKRHRLPVVELFVPAPELNSSKLALLRPGDRIQGFASYEEFWRAGSQGRVKHG